MAAPSVDKSRVPRGILLAVAAEIYGLIGEKGLWQSTEGLAEAIESARHSSYMTMNPQTIYDAAKTLNREVVSRLNFHDGRASKIKDIMDETVNRIHFDILMPLMPSVPLTPAAPPVLTREGAQAEFLRIHENIKTIPLNPKLIDHPEDRVAMEAWFAHHESRMSGVTKPSQLMRIIADLLRLMGKSSSEPVKIAKTYLVKEYKDLEPLVKLLGGRRTKKQRGRKRQTRKN